MKFCTNTCIAVSYWPVITETQVWPQASQCGMCDGHWDGFLSKYLVFPCQYHSANAPHSLIHLSLALYNLINLQLCCMMHLKNYICVCNTLSFTSVFCWRKYGFTVTSNNLSKFHWKGTKVNYVYNIHSEFQYYVTWMVAGYSTQRLIMMFVDIKEFNLLQWDSLCSY